MKRSKSNTVTPDPDPSWKEPLSGPMSATCYCRMMARRDMRRDAIPGLYGADLEEHEATAIKIKTDLDIEEIGSALKELREMGLQVEIRIIASEVA